MIMKNEKQAQIIEAETLLRNAMLESNIEVLDQLLSPNLVFTNHLGQVLGKQDDLNAHKSGLLHISEVTVSHQDIKIIADTAIVLAEIAITGRYDGSPANGVFRFTRVWQHVGDDHWQVIVVHSSIVSS